MAVLSVWILSSRHCPWRPKTLGDKMIILFMREKIDREYSLALFDDDGRCRKVEIGCNQVEEKTSNNQTKRKQFQIFLKHARRRS